LTDLDLKYTKYTLKPFSDDEKVEIIINAWKYSNKCDVELRMHAKILLNKIPKLKPISSPLPISMIAEVYKHHDCAKFQMNLYEVFNKYFEIKIQKLEDLQTLRHFAVKRCITNSDRLDAII
jgi:hypothetical protein